MRTIRVLHFFKTFLPDTFGGIEQVIHQLALGCRTSGIESEVLALSRGAKQEPRISRFGYSLVRSPYLIDVASTPISVSGAIRFRAMVRDADIVHLHFPWPFSDVVSLFSGHGKPVVVTYHSDIIKQQRLLQLYRPLMNLFLKSATCLVATSPAYVESSQTLLRWREKVRVIPIGIAEDSYPTVDPTRLATWRKRMGGKFFLFVGVLRYYKGLTTLLEAVDGQDLTIVIVGSGGDEAALRNEAVRRKINQVQFVGKLGEEDKVALLHLCLGVVLPSTRRSEAFGISLLEGAMFSRPLISCEIGTGTSYVNLAGHTGLVVKPEDPDALRRAMCHLRDHPAEAERMGRNARNRYEALFTAMKMCTAYSELYRNTANAHPAAARLVAT